MCHLRGTTPEPKAKRLKLFMFSAAGVGKTTAALQFPRPYIIDAERGTENYATLVNERGGCVYQTTNVEDAIQEIRALLTEKHDFRTLVIDPITPLYDDLLDRCETKVGSAHGRHYGEANKVMKRMANLILALDMNVIVTAHAKTEYDDNQRRIGVTYDGWRKLDYWFDLVLELSRGRGAKAARTAKVVKTRLEGFADGAVLPWTYEEVAKRYDPEILEAACRPVAVASPEQVRDLRELVQMVRLPDSTVERWFAKAGVDAWEDMPAETAEKCVQYIQDRIRKSAHAPRNGVARV